MDSKAVINYFESLGKEKLSGRVIGLIGVLGAGKTHLVKETIGKIHNDLKDEVSSPTYTLCNIYKSDVIEIHHYDLYRIESEDELYDTGIMESIEKENILVFIEWIDIYSDLMDLCDDVIEIQLIEQDKRNHILKNK